MTDTIHVLYPGRGVCDFCSLQTSDLRRYKCKTFDDVTMTKLSEGRLKATSVQDWAACPECAKLIDTGEWDALANRSMDHFPEPVTEDVRPILLSYMKGLHKQFRENRIHEVS